MSSAARIANLLASFLLASVLSSATLAQTFTVVRNADDTSAGSLRWAITQANSVAGAATVNFNPALTGANTITLTSDLPSITNPSGVTPNARGGPRLATNAGK